MHTNMQLKKIETSFNHFVVVDALRTLMKKGRSKHRNIMLVGQRNCAKTFPLELLAEVFAELSCDPSWIGVDIF